MSDQVTHTAIADIRESLAELKFYRRTIFKQPGVSFKEYLVATRPERESSRQPPSRPNLASNTKSPGRGSAKKAAKKSHR